MIFRNPVAWLGLLALAVPVAIHLLARAPAAPVVLPSLRFVPRSRLRALRRRFLTDRGLLAVRLAILALAAAALADPLAATACRTAAWNARRARAIVYDAPAPVASPRLAALPAAAEQREFVAEGHALDALIARAAAWLATTPPARREIVVVGALAAGSIEAADLASVPASVGLRFLREAELPQSRRVAGPAFTTGAGETIVRHAGDVLLDGPFTVREPPAGRALVDAPSGQSIPGAVTIESIDGVVRAPELGVEALATSAAPDAWRDALKAALAVGVPITPEAASRRLVFALPPGPSPAPGRWEPWMAEVVEAVARDPDVAAEARAAMAPDDNVLDGAWAALATGGSGETIAAAAPVENAGGSALAVVAQTDPASPLLAALARAAMRARAAWPPSGVEIVPMSDAALEALGRPATGVAPDTTDTSALSDRRWFWSAVLLLLGVEAWMRRPRHRASAREVGDGRAA